MIDKIMANFASMLRTEEVEIYNEFSLQHELGVYLRTRLAPAKVQFERNVSFFGFEKQGFIKREIDISLFSSDGLNLDLAIELKFPRNGQHPEQIFSFCKDVVFIEQLKEAGFRKALAIIFVDDPLFYQGRPRGICKYFRSGETWHGQVNKPTGTQMYELMIKGDYRIHWQEVVSPMKYTVVEA